MPISHSYGKWISTYSRRQRRRHTVATERQRVLPFPRKGGVDKTLDKGVVDTVTPVFQVSEELMPDVCQLLLRFTGLSISSPRGRMTIRSQHMELTAYTTDYLLSLKRLSARSYLFGGKLPLRYCSSSPQSSPIQPSKYSASLSALCSKA